MKLAVVPMLPTLYGRRYQLAKNLAHNHAVHFIVWNMPYPVNAKTLLDSLLHAWQKKDWQRDGMYIHKVRRLPFFLPFANRWLFQRQLRALAAKYDIEAVISQSFFNETEPPKDLPLFFDYNDDYPAFARIYGSRAYKLAYKILGVERTVERQQRRARGIFAVSSLLMKKAQRLNAHVAMVPNGVEKEFIETKIPRRLTYGRHSIGYISTFGKWSQIMPLLGVVKDLQKTIPDIRLLLIGGGPELEAAKRFVATHNMEEVVTIFGHISDRGKVREILRNCEVCVNLCDKNDFRDAASPMKVIDYSALGKKIISTNVAEVVALKLPNIVLYKNQPELKGFASVLKKAFAMPSHYPMVRKEIAQKYAWDTQLKKMNAMITEGIKE
jgi:glycosyltransferase involved in cell wall biosynthesis